jgi:hypothetical protein
MPGGMGVYGYSTKSDLTKMVMKMVVSYSFKNQHFLSIHPLNPL